MTDAGEIGMVLVYGSLFLGCILGAISLAIFAWNNAPVVGGEWWPYIRVAVTLIGGIIGAKIGAIIGSLVGAVFGFVLAVVL